MNEIDDEKAKKSVKEIKRKYVVNGLDWKRIDQKFIFELNLEDKIIEGQNNDSA